MRKGLLIITLLCIAVESYAGSEGNIRTEVAPVCRTEQYYDELNQTKAAGDRIGFNALFNSNKCFVAMRGDRFLILKEGWTSKKIRMLSGKYNEQAGWTFREALE